jgi:hypothetical protein
MACHPMLWLQILSIGSSAKRAAPVASRNAVCHGRQGTQVRDSPLATHSRRLNMKRGGSNINPGG